MQTVPLPREDMSNVETVDLLNVLRHLLLKSPDRGLLEAVATTLRRVLCETRGDSTESARALLDEVETLLAAGDEALTAAQVDYTRLFFGPGAPAVPPYASLYQGQGRMLMQEGAAEARKAYRDLGFVLEDRSVQPDHAGVEIELLMATLARSMKREALEPDLVLRVRAFLDAHAMRWLPVFFDRLAQRASTTLYRRTAELGSMVLAQTSGVLARSGGAE